MLWLMAGYLDGPLVGELATVGVRVGGHSLVCGRPLVCHSVSTSFGDQSSLYFLGHIPRLCSVGLHCNWQGNLPTDCWHVSNQL